MNVLKLAAIAAFLVSSTAFAGPTPAKSLSCTDNATEGTVLSFNIPSMKDFFDERGSQDVYWTNVDFMFSGKKIGTSLYQPWAYEMGALQWYQAAQPKNFTWACSWESCPIRNVVLNVYSMEDHVAKGTVSFSASPNGNAGWVATHEYAITCSY